MNEERRRFLNSISTRLNNYAKTVEDMIAYRTFITEDLFEESDSDCVPSSDLDPLDMDEYLDEDDDDTYLVLPFTKSLCFSAPVQLPLIKDEEDVVRPTLFKDGKSDVERVFTMPVPPLKRGGVDLEKKMFNSMCNVHLDNSRNETRMITSVSKSKKSGGNKHCSRYTNRAHVFSDLKTCTDSQCGAQRGKCGVWFGGPSCKLRHFGETQDEYVLRRGEPILKVPRVVNVEVEQFPSLDEIRQIVISAREVNASGVEIRAKPTISI